ncbi:unnamed protein product [Withania somnifera]
MAQLIKLILANLFLAMIFSHIIQPIEGRHLMFENTNDPSRPYVHTVKYATEKVLIHNYVATATPTPPISPVQTVPQPPPPPGHPDGFGPSGPGHSPGIGHSLTGN